MTRLLPLLVLLLAGCAHVVGYAGTHPGYVKCRGKGSITGSGQQSITVVGGGAGQNTFSLMVDCGDGLEYEQGPTAPAPALALPPRP